MSTYTNAHNELTSDIHLSDRDEYHSQQISALSAFKMQSDDDSNSDFLACYSILVEEL
jgi:hypothetical protein